MKYSLKKMLRQVSIEKRLTYTFLILSLIPIIIVGYLTMHIANKAIVNKATSYIKQIIGTVEDQLKNELNNYEGLLTELMVNPTIQKAYATYGEMTYSKRAQLKEEVNQVVTPKLSSNPNIRDIKIINTEKEVIYQRGYLLNDESHIDSMLQAMQEIGGMVQCFMQPIYGENYIIISKSINSTYTRKHVGYIILVLKEEAIRMIYEDINLGENANIYLFDGLNQILSVQHQNKQTESKILDVYEMAKTLNTDENKNKSYIQFDNHNGGTYTLMQDEVSQYKIKSVSMIPNDYLLKETKIIGKRVLLIIVLCFIFFGATSKLICRSITEPLKKLMSYIESAMEHKFKKGYIDNSPDELGVLGRTYVQINNEMYDMIKKIEQDEKERRELELNMLQAQINPHFLFNTLNSLRWISMMSGADSVSEGILALSDLLKNTIIQKAEYITLESELQNVKNYVLIQKLRYGDSFKINWDIDNSLIQFKTLKFILQPIIENAILHGGRDDESILHITLSLKKGERGLIIEISDDGKGFNPSKIVQEEQKDVRLSGIGIHNVIQRIRLHFGEEYGLTVMSKPNEGTKVILHIPNIEGDGINV